MNEIEKKELLSMGCDIHLHQEIKINDQWHHYSMPRVRRNYDLFSLMAGVRGDLDPVVQPKGIPSNPTAITLLDYERMGVDAHTSSWLNMGEVKELYKRVRDSRDFTPREKELEDFGYLFGWEWAQECLKMTGASVSDFRWVFWFDN